MEEDYPEQAWICPRCRDKEELRKSQESLNVTAEDMGFDGLDKFVVEVEKSTSSKKVRTFQNAQKAMNQGVKCLFVSNKVEEIHDNLLSPPKCKSEHGLQDDEKYRYYTVSDEFVPVGKDYSLVRESSSKGAETKQTRWVKKEDGSIVVRDTDGKEFYKFKDVDEIFNLETQDVEYCFRETEDGDYIVYENNRKIVYEDDEENDASMKFKEEYSPIKMPFIPEQEMNRKPTAEDFGFITFATKTNDEIAYKDQKEIGGGVSFNYIGKEEMEVYAALDEEQLEKLTEITDTQTKYLKQMTPEDAVRFKEGEITLKEAANGVGEEETPTEDDSRHRVGGDGNSESSDGDGDRDDRKPQVEVDHETAQNDDSQTSLHQTSSDEEEDVGDDREDQDEQDTSPEDDMTETVLEDLTSEQQEDTPDDDGDSSDSDDKPSITDILDPNPDTDTDSPDNNSNDSDLDINGEDFLKTDEDSEKDTQDDDVGMGEPDPELVEELEGDTDKEDAEEDAEEKIEDSESNDGTEAAHDASDAEKPVDEEDSLQEDSSPDDSDSEADDRTLRETLEQEATGEDDSPELKKMSVEAFIDERLFVYDEDKLTGGGHYTEEVCAHKKTVFDEYQDFCEEVGVESYGSIWFWRNNVFFSYLPDHVEEDRLKIEDSELADPSDGRGKVILGIVLPD